MDRKADVNLSKVSVIIPAYNREAFIRETIESVLEQTYSNIELIVVDDGSTDNTLKIVKEYKEKLDLLQHPGGVNKGQSAAINLGLKVSTGEYIAILDSDDLFAPKKIELQIEHLIKNLDVGLVYANGIAIDTNGAELHVMIQKGHKEENKPELVLLNSYYNIPSNALIRKSVFEIVGGFDEELRSAQDHDMAIRIAEVTRLNYIDKVLWYYRRHKETQSVQHSERRWKNGFKVLRKACSRYPYGYAIIFKRLAVLHYRYGQSLLIKRKICSACFHFIVAFCYDPIRSIRVIIGLERN